MAHWKVLKLSDLFVCLQLSTRHTRQLFQYLSHVVIGSASCGLTICHTAKRKLTSFHVLPQTPAAQHQTICGTSMCCATVVETYSPQYWELFWHRETTQCKLLPLVPELDIWLVALQQLSCWKVTSRKEGHCPLYKFRISNFLPEYLKKQVSNNHVLMNVWQYPTLTISYIVLFLYHIQNHFGGIFWVFRIGLPMASSNV